MTIFIDNNYVYITKDYLKIVLSCLGAAIVEIKYGDDYLTMTPKSYNELDREDIYYGKTIGPIANRVKDGLIVINSKNYYLDLNEGCVSNHSGKDGLSNVLFDVETKNDKVIFTHQGNQFGGQITYKVIYSFPSDGEIKIEYEVAPSTDAIISLTNHTFFNLGEPNINNLSLIVPSDEFIESDKDTLVPLCFKPIIPCLDFNKEKAIIKDLNDPYLINHKTNGYDHCFLLAKDSVVLKSPKYILEVESDYQCCHIYSDNYPDRVITKNSDALYRRAVAIEMVDDYLNRPVVLKDQIYHRYIIYKFSLNR